MITILSNEIKISVIDLYQWIDQPRDVFDPIYFNLVTKGKKASTFADAISIDKSLALESTYWGDTHIKGSLWKDFNFNNVDEFIKWLLNSTDNQYKAFSILLVKIRPEWGAYLRAGDWKSFIAEYGYGELPDKMYPILSMGDTGKYVQFLNVELGKKSNLKLFDNETQRLVMEFQKQNNLKIDGIVGQQTWIVLGKEPSVTKPVDTSTIKEVLGSGGISLISIKYLSAYMFLGIGVILVLLYIYLTWKEFQAKKSIEKVKIENGSTQTSNSNSIGNDSIAASNNETEPGRENNSIGIPDGRSGSGDSTGQWIQTGDSNNSTDESTINRVLISDNDVKFSLDF